MMDNKIGINQRAENYESTTHNGKTVMRHRLIWEQQVGKIPEGHVIHHKDFDKTNNRLDNLECLSRREHAMRHRKPNRIRIRYPSGAVKVIKKEE